ncbi:MAG: hypothetical protein WCI75_13260 [candidate division NC10 bacterium]
MIRVVMLAALPQESRPLLKLLGTSRRLAGEPFPTWLQRSSHAELLLVETSMGEEGARRVARHVLSGMRIDLLVSVGFAGSLWPSFRLGQVVWSRELAAYDERGGSPSAVAFRPASIVALTAFCQSHDVRPARFLTLDRVRSKAGMAGRFAEDPTVVDMESTTVAAAAYGRGVPFLGLRAISDESTHEIDWKLDAIVDRAGRISAPRVMCAVLRRPVLLASLLRLWRSSRIAGRTLAKALVALLQLPEEDLHALAEQLQLLRMPEAAEEPSATEDAAPGGAPAPPSSRDHSDA